MNCILCASESSHFFSAPTEAKSYLRCPECDLIFMLPKYRLNDEQERDRYLTHKNSLDDVEYSKYVKPIFDYVIKHVELSSKGLDYGCGEVPMITHLLKKNGYDLSTFDPYFKNDLQSLESTYDFIVSVEVIEHFYSPAQEFTRLKSLLNKTGFIALMTSPHDQQTNFAQWHYRRDPTHVCFYSEKTFAWIKNHFGFDSYEFIQPRTHILKK